MISRSIERETEAYVALHAESKRLQGQAAHYLPGGSSRTAAYFDPYPFFVDRGHGHYVYDVDGNRYLDFMINATSLILGHTDPEVHGCTPGAGRREELPSPGPQRRR